MHGLSIDNTFDDLEWPLTPISRSRHFLKSNSVKTARLEDKVTIAQWETIPNMWNGTMFGDLDWPTSASRRFVSISWASCFFMVITATAGLVCTLKTAETASCSTYSQDLRCRLRQS